jgi:hypothetical protein
MIEEIKYVIEHPKLSDNYKFNEVCRLLKIDYNKVSADEIVDMVKKEFKITYGNTRTRNNPDKLKSANVWKFKYDDKKMELVIQFQDGDIYTYTQVNEQLFKDVVGGNAAAITDGENKWGKWFVGKKPSVGASVHKNLVKAGVPYAKTGKI